MGKKKRGKKDMRAKLLSGFFVVLKTLFDISFLIGAAFLTIFIYTYYNSVPAEELVKRSINQTTIIYDSTGEHILYKIHGEENRKIIQHDDIPDSLRNATIAIEDERFYKHFGVDIIGIFRAIRENFAKNSAAQGGSTITQQLVRNAFLTREKTITRKFKEIVLAIKVERSFSKEQVIDFYLNEIPYGSNAYGAEAAALIFFNKNARDLTPDESAVLASLPKATTRYSPYGSSTDLLVERQQIVLKKMEDLGYLESEEYATLKTVDTLEKVEPFVEEIDAPHFVFFVREQLEEIFGDDILERGGYKVYTTLDYDMQKRAEQTVRNYAEKLPGFGASNASLVAVDPKSGAVKAMVGSIDYHDEENDGNVNVSVQLRQPGSSIKPIIYAAAFERGFQPETLIYDVSTSFGPDGQGDEYRPDNFDGKKYGLVPMRKALQGSLNIPAVKTLYLVGKDNAIDFAERLGMTTFTERNRYGLSLALGGGEVKLVEQLGAFATFANDGVRGPVHGVTKIVALNGDEDVLTPTAERVLDAEVARKVNSVLSDNKARAYVFGNANVLNFPDYTVAAKTGTTQDYRDAWTMGYTPSIAVGVWVGNNDATLMKEGSLGSKVASPLWRQFMEGELAYREDEPFQEYEKVEADVPMVTGKRPEGDGKVRYIKNASGKDIKESKLHKYRPDEYRIVREGGTRSLLHYVNRDNPLDDSLKPDRTTDMYKRWEGSLSTQ